jgi:hypothetical protein
MTRFFDLDEANAALPEVRAILESLRDEKHELVQLRDDILVLDRSIEAGADAKADAPTAPTEASVGGAGRTLDAGDPADLEAERTGRPDSDDDTTRRRILRLRMQGVIDRMQAGVARIDDLGVTLREIDTGLIDFPALASGRQIWLCWRLGEGDIAFWHELGDGFGGRRALADLT